MFTPRIRVLRRDGAGRHAAACPGRKFLTILLRANRLFLLCRMESFLHH